jgi:hypothetical protein
MAYHLISGSTSHLPSPCQYQLFLVFRTCMLLFQKSGSALRLPFCLEKGNPSIVSNYRPISLICTRGKIMESIIRDNLMEFCKSNNIKNINQHGFIPGKSTFSQLLECQYEWCSSLSLAGPSLAGPSLAGPSLAVPLLARCTFFPLFIQTLFVFYR